MRKIDPAGVRTDFHDEIVELIDHFRRVASALSGSPNELGDLSRLAETTFLSAFVSFERFLSDLFFAYINRDFLAYQGDLSERIQTSVGNKFGAWAKARVAFNSKKHVNVPELEGILDPDGFNLTFSNAQDIRAKATRWLAAPHRARVHSLSNHDDRLIDTARAIRNFVAHRSKSSKDIMNQKLASVQSAAHNQNLGRGEQHVHNVGAFLKAVFGGQRRAELYALRLQSISAQM